MIAILTDFISLIINSMKISKSSLKVGNVASRVTKVVHLFSLKAKLFVHLFSLKAKNSFPQRHVFVEEMA